MNDRPEPGRLLARMRQSVPLVHCITNYVAMNLAANVLLAAGASPAMVHAPEEAGEFAGLSDALTVNIGTLSTDWLAGMRQAAAAAVAAGHPWVLDPVAHQATAFRRRSVAELLALRPTIVRGNASEIVALAGGRSSGRAMDSRDGMEVARDAARTVARRHGAVVAVTGPVDFVTAAGRDASIAGGWPLMPQVTALGCALTGLIGAFAAVAPEDPFGGTVAALAMFAEAGEQAGRRAEGPGSFSWRFLDALAAVGPGSLAGRIQPEPAQCG